MLARPRQRFTRARMGIAAGGVHVYLAAMLASTETQSMGQGAA
jgi:hypothetical protein